MSLLGEDILSQLKTQVLLPQADISAASSSETN
jgi:hypothetical protein